MAMSGLKFSFLALASFASAQSIVQDAAAACAAIGASFSSPNVTVNFAEHVVAGQNLTFTQAYNLSTCDRLSQFVPVDMCRIAMYVATSSRSGITLEAWLPTNWTGRFLSTGNGGTSGCIQYEDLAYTAGMGFATVGANNGHNGTRGTSFYHNNEVVADFAYRSIHTGVVVGKEITEAYYKENYTKSYYLGCSTGGRQGFKSAQSFPDDFDGIVAGAPAVGFNNLTSWSGRFLLVQGTNTSASFLTPYEWVLVHEEILVQCDAIDGVVDGIVEDPLLCNFRPESMLCAPGNTTNCLTAPQVVAVRETFSPCYGVDGALIFPAMQPGSELEAAFVYYTGEPFIYTSDWFQFAIYENPDWDPFNLTVQQAAYAAHKNPSDISSFQGDLSAFRNKGGKILHYHGQADPIITSDNSPRYYDHVSTTMQLPSSSLDEFYRFFRIGGMSHCESGDGAWEIGQTALGATGTPLDAQNNVLMRMVEWVEKGDAYAPETVTGTKFVNDTVSLGVDFVRQHCKYPTRNVCVDPENYQKPEAWKCVQGF